MSILNTQTLHARLAEVKARHPEPPWAERIAVTEYAVGVLICQAPGHPNDRHYHLRDEWWLVLEDRIDFSMDQSDREFFRTEVVPRISHTFDKIVLLDPRDYRRALEV